MYKYEVAFTLGRFSLPHIQHIAIITEALKLAETVVVIIGSSFDSKTIKNPWTCVERAQMLAAALDPSVKYRVKFESLLDSPYDDNEWYGYVEDIKSKRTQNGKLTSVFVEHAKDETSWYVKELVDRKVFDAWVDPFDNSTADHTIGSTHLRHVLYTHGFEKFASRPDVVRVVPKPVLEWLENWIASSGEDYANIVAEYAAMKQLHSVMERVADCYPYAINICASDTVLIHQDHVLVVVRGGTFGKGKFALPGGHLELNETVEQCAVRELEEETGLKFGVQHISAMRTFSNPHRSDKWRVISHTALIDVPDHVRLDPVANDDAADVKWVHLGVLESLRYKFFDDHYHIIKQMVKYRNK